MYNFEFVKPSSVAEAVEALKGEDAQPLSGGQTLIPTMKARLAAPATLVSLTGIAEMKGVCRDGDVMVIGGATPHGVVARELRDVFPGLADLAAGIGDPAVQSRGTIGGSLANNDPSACWPAGALGTGATIKTNAREIAADDYFQGLFETALDEGEIVTEVRVPIADAAHYAKFHQPASRFPLVASFVCKTGGGVRVAITGASEGGVFRWTAAEEALASNFSADALSDLSVPEDDMIGDIHGSGAYRAHLVGVMTKRAVAALT